MYILSLNVYIHTGPCTSQPEQNHPFVEGADSDNVAGFQSTAACDFQQGRQYHYSETVQCECREGYENAALQDTFVTCGANGHWETKLLYEACQRM